MRRIAVVLTMATLGAATKQAAAEKPIITDSRAEGAARAPLIFIRVAMDIRVVELQPGKSLLQAVELAAAEGTPVVMEEN